MFYVQFKIIRCAAQQEYVTHKKKEIQKQET